MLVSHLWRPVNNPGSSPEAYVEEITHPNTADPRTFTFMLAKGGNQQQIHNVGFPLIETKADRFVKVWVGQDTQHSYKTGPDAAPTTLHSRTGGQVRGKKFLHWQHVHGSVRAASAAWMQERQSWWAELWQLKESRVLGCEALQISLHSSTR